MIQCAESRVTIHCAGPSGGSDSEVIALEVTSILDSD